MSCIPYYPIQFFRSPKEQSKELLKLMFATNLHEEDQEWRDPDF
jgi:hypothetical protein